MPGPMPAPTKLKLLKGVRPARINQNEPKPRVASAAIPAGWAAQMSQAAKGFWKRNARKLIDLGLLTEIDLDGFRILCELIAQRQELAKIIKKEGYIYIVKNKDGIMHKAHPAVAMKDKCDSQVRQYLMLFGMAPAPRGSISAEPPSGSDDDDLD